MLEFLLVLICGSILVSGVLAVWLEDLMAAIISAGMASLFASVSYVLLAAPDVAMAEASIGSGLATLILLYTLRRTGYGKARDERIGK
jgi:energy-converting hydrogenase B subunit D